MSSSLRAKPVLDDSAYLAYFLGTIIYYTVVVVGNIVLIITHNAQVTLQKNCNHYEKKFTKLVSFGIN